jgi:hypothetical protein
MESPNYHVVEEPILEPKYSFGKTLSLLTIFVLLTPIALAVSVFALIFATQSTIAKEPTSVLAAETSIQPGANIFAALPDNMPSIESSIGIGDARVEIVRNYLRRYQSPLTHLADYIVKVADEEGIDFRLTTAIAQQESNLCKIIPPDTYNCWGWGIHSRGTLGFSSYEEGIRTVSRGLKKEYIDKGYTTPEEIMSKYTPLSNGSWAFGVDTFMSDMQ